MRSSALPLITCMLQKRATWLMLAMKFLSTIGIPRLLTLRFADKENNTAAEVSGQINSGVVRS
jgi:hypothetical protein